MVDRKFGAVKAIANIREHCRRTNVGTNFEELVIASRMSFEKATF
jgi:hypothetical protein